MIHRIGSMFKYRNITAIALFFIMFCPILTSISSEFDQHNQLASFPKTSDPQQIDSLLWKMSSGGLPGTYPTMRPFMSNFTDAGPNYIIVGTDKGLAVISATNGSVKINFNTFDAVIDIVVTGDLSGDNQRDLVAVVLDQGHPNIFAISSADGQQLWNFNPTVLGFNKETLLQQNYTTFSWDIESVEDLNGDGVQDLVLSSWFRIYALNGVSGQVLWLNSESCTDDIWKIMSFTDVNQDNHKEIAAGSEKGEVVVLQGQNGQEIWSFTIPNIEINRSYMFGGSITKYPVPVSDMAIGPDVDGDSYRDLLVTGDDGIFRILSGKAGFQISTAIVYPNATSPLDMYSSFSGTWYTYEERFFTKSGAKIYLAPDMNGDGKEDWMVLAYNLERSSSSPSKDRIFGTFLNVSGTTLGNKVPEIVVGNWSSTGVMGDASSPCILTIGSQKRLYYHTTTPVSTISAGLFYYVFNDLPTENPTVVAEIEDREAEALGGSGDLLRESYLINIGDVTGDGISDLFGFSRQDTYYAFDANGGKLIWIRRIQGYSPSLIPIDDLNGDGAQDFLYSSRSPFIPEWGASSIENNLNLDVCAINGLTGSAIWRLQLPPFYEGILDIQSIGDLSGDGFGDFAGWIIPSFVPQEIKDYIYARTGQDSIGIGVSNREGIYRALLANYTRLIVINGLSGNILDSQPLFESPYRFYRTNTASLEYNQYYNRINGQASGSWFASEIDRKGYNWAAIWAPSTLQHANTIQIQAGLGYTGTVLDTWDDDAVNYTIEADFNGEEYQTIVDWDITLGLSENKSIGTMEYPLSELERISALKIQNQLMVNRSDNPSFFNVTYSLYNFTSNSWVSCNWTGATSWDSGTNQFPDLYGNWTTTYRSSNENFVFSTSQFRTDAMCVITRGTCDRDASIKLDHENKTSLSHFIDPSSKTVSLRVNVTNTLHPFNLSIDSLGIVAMAWGLAPGKYDQTYTYDNRAGGFTNVQLLDLQVQDFQVLNGTGDNLLDVLAITGYPTVSTYGGVSLRLFDLKNSEVFTKWTTNSAKLPLYKVRAHVLNTTQLNNWILTGAYSDYYSSKIIIDPHWDSAISRFDNFSDSSVIIDFGATWNSGEYAPSFDVENDFFFPTTISVTKNGTKGLMVFKELTPPGGTSYSIYGEFRILNATTFGNLGIVPCQVETIGVNYKNLLLSGEAQVLLAEDDFNGDGFLDHVGISEVETSNPYLPSSVEKTISIYSGNVAGGGVPEVLHETVISDYVYNYGGGYPSGYPDGSSTSDEEKHMPCASIGDNDGDGAAELAIGLEAASSYGGYKGSSVIHVNVKNESESVHVFDPYVSAYSYGGPMGISKQFYTQMINVGSPPSQKTSTVFVERSKFKKGSYGYTTSPISEILDIANHQTLLQIQVEVDSIDLLQDLNNDGKGEYLLSSGGILYCYNSKFSVSFSKLVDGETKTTNEFNLEWSSPASQPVYQLMVDNMEHGFTSSTSALVSLGSGSRHVQVLLYDTAGIFISVDDATIIIPSSNTMMIVTVIIVVGLVFALILRKRRKASKRRKYAVEAEKSSSTTAPQYKTNGKIEERNWSPKG